MGDLFTLLLKEGLVLDDSTMKAIQQGAEVF